MSNMGEHGEHGVFVGSILDLHITKASRTILFDITTYFKTV